MLLRQHPFQPFVVQMANGQSFEVRQPEMAALQKSNLIISSLESDQFEICSIQQIANAHASQRPSCPEPGWSTTPHR